MTQTHNVQQVITGILTAADVSVTDIKEHIVGEQVFYVIHTPLAAYFLEQGAQGLRALNLLVKQVCVSKKVDTPQHFSLDINNFYLDKVTALTKQAETLARRAKQLECEIEMPPMSSYERMIVHETLKTIDGVTTESCGEGRLRHVVIRVEKN